MIALERSDRTVDAICKAAFPEYRGRKINAVVADSITMWATQWDGGARRTYRAVRVADMVAVELPRAPFLESSPSHTSPMQIPDGCVIVVRTEGHSDRVEIHAPSALITPALPSPVELTADEKTVLVATRSLKSSYGGVKDLRFSEASAMTGITRDRWDVAKAALIARKLLNAAGAITVAGRNAIGHERF